MSRSITEYDILISCPGDMEWIVPLIQETIRKFNDQFSRVLSIRLNPKHWTYSAYNQSGGHAQDLLNEQFIHACDAAIAVFWTRFGAPTQKYGSGTEEEIEDMLASGKQVFLYFCEKPVEPKMLADEKAVKQYEKVQSFKKKYAAEGKGIYWPFSSDDEFKELLFAHLSNHFLPLKKEEDQASSRKPKLKLFGITDKKLTDSISTTKYSFDGEKSVKSKIEEIKKLFERISCYSIDDCELEPSPFSLNVYKKVSITQENKNLIVEAAKALGIELPKNFFALGRLRENSMMTAVSMLGGRSFEGTKDEKEKYNNLVRLSKRLQQLPGWIELEETFGKLLCLRMALANCGTSIDEDIDVIMRFTRDSIISLDRLPKMSESAYDTVTEHYPFYDLFGIPATSQYNYYETSTRIQHAQSVPQPLDYFGRSRDYHQEYAEAIASAFEYEFFLEGDTVVVKLHFDYIKHNTVIAFPSVLFVSEQLSQFDYSIRSKNLETETSGTIIISERADT